MHPTCPHDWTWLQSHLQTLSNIVVTSSKSGHALVSLSFWHHLPLLAPTSSPTLCTTDTTFSSFIIAAQVVSISLELMMMMMLCFETPFVSANQYSFHPGSLLFIPVTFHTFALLKLGSNGFSPKQRGSISSAPKIPFPGIAKNGKSHELFARRYSEGEEVW